MKNHITVLFIAHTNDMSGSSHSLFQLMMELRKDYGIKPLLLVQKSFLRRSDYSLKNICEQHNIDCYSFYFFWFKYRQGFLGLLKCLSNLLWYPYIFLKLHKIEIDIIHSNSSVIDLGVWLSRIKKKPHVWHFREFGYLDFRLKSVLGNSYERYLYSIGGTFICISDAVKRCYQSKIIMDSIRLIYNGIAVPPDSQLTCHSSKTINLCMVGRISQAKNQLLALQGINYAIKYFNINYIHLYFIGFEEPDYVDQLKKYISENKINDYVTFVGESRDVPNLLSKMDIGLMLSRKEAFGRVTVEYMMHNLAVIAVDTGANPEIISNNVDGFLVKAGDYKAIAEKIRLLSVDKNLLGIMSNRGREKAQKQFSSKINTEKIHNLYMELLSK